MAYEVVFDEGGKLGFIFYDGDSLGHSGRVEFLL